MRLYIYREREMYSHLAVSRTRLRGIFLVVGGCTPNLPTKIIATKIR